MPRNRKPLPVYSGAKQKRLTPLSVEEQIVIFRQQLGETKSEAWNAVKWLSLQAQATFQTQTLSHANQ